MTPAVERSSRVLDTAARDSHIETEGLTSHSPQHASSFSNEDVIFVGLSLNTLIKTKAENHNSKMVVVLNENSYTLSLHNHQSRSTSDETSADTDGLAAATKP